MVLQPQGVWISLSGLRAPFPPASFFYLVPVYTLYLHNYLSATHSFNTY